MLISYSHDKQDYKLTLPVSQSTDNTLKTLVSKRRTRTKPFNDELHYLPIILVHAYH